ncbi:MAG TPA: hypothetical protein VLT59_17550 [Steroidobacteraceae bacterium]|nr:hypothetical protein [Steroidobacteraceae bacterium]
MAARLGMYAPVRLTADLSGLRPEERAALVPLIEASRIMDELFWQNAYGDPRPFLAALDAGALREFAQINYGPWDRLNGDEPFVPGVGPKPPGANFYPPDMTREEFEAAELPGKDDLYTLVRRDASGALETVPYHVAYGIQLEEAARHLREAAELLGDTSLSRYLDLRAAALVTDEYQPSDLAWLDMKDNRLDVVIGAIETYEDALFGYKAAYEAYVLIKDLDWSARLERYAQFLPQLQESLPVPEQYRRETPGTDSDLNAYDVVFYAGHSNAGSKTIAINLPNDEQVQLEKGTRRLQLKNAMRAKFDQILVPIAGELLVPEQRDRVTFDAFFENVMFHEVAHGLGIKNTVNGRGTVREALREHAGALEEAKADVLGLYMIMELTDRGELPRDTLEDHFVTFLAGFFRSVRFGAASAHGRANMVQFNFLEDQGAFTRDPESGLYRVDYPRMREAIRALAARILELQGDGDYDGTATLLATQGVIDAGLKESLDRLAAADIPVDIVFEQGPEVLGLTSTER